MSISRLDAFVDYNVSIYWANDKEINFPILVRKSDQMVTVMHACVYISVYISAYIKLCIIPNLYISSTNVGTYQDIYLVEGDALLELAKFRENS